jgi:glutamyl-tRNA reductase
MPFLATGVEHKTAPLSVRERIALEADRIATSLHGQAGIEEVAVLSTCNRTEIYLYTEESDRAAEAAREALHADTASAHYIQRWDDLDAVRHLFRVASGIESQVLGESQILGQVRATHETAQREGTIGTNLHHLFRTAISCARRARAESRLGHTDRSIGAEAVRIAETEMGTLEGARVLLVGGGEVIRLAAAELQGKHLAALHIANRTHSVAQQIAGEFGGTAVPAESMAGLLSSVDVVITATASHDHLLTAGDIPTLHRPLHILDLAIPRDVDPAAGSIPNVRLHDLDSLLPGGTEAQWREDVAGMESVIEAELKDFEGWMLTRRVVPVISSLRAHVEAVSEAELRRVAPQLEGLDERERAAVESLTQRLIDKMFHHLVIRLRLAAQTDPKLVEAAEFFFLHGEGGLFEHAAEQLKDIPTEHTT